MKKYLVFVIQAYEEENAMTQKLTDYVELQLIDRSVEGAMKRAHEIVNKKNYRLSMVIEKTYENT